MLSQIKTAMDGDLLDVAEASDRAGNILWGGRGSGLEGANGAPGGNCPRTSGGVAAGRRFARRRLPSPTRPVRAIASAADGLGVGRSRMTLSARPNASPRAPGRRSGPTDLAFIATTIIFVAARKLKSAVIHLPLAAGGPEELSSVLAAGGAQ